MSPRASLFSTVQDLFALGLHHHRFALPLGGCQSRSHDLAFADELRSDLLQPRSRAHPRGCQSPKQNSIVSYEKAAPPSCGTPRRSSHYLRRYFITHPKNVLGHGQYDHVRIYGQDYYQRLAAAGFQVQAVIFFPADPRRNPALCPQRTSSGVK